MSGLTHFSDTGGHSCLVFFVSYVAFEVPSNLVLKKFRPSRFIPCTMVSCQYRELTLTCRYVGQYSKSSVSNKEAIERIRLIHVVGLVTNYGQLLALRFCLGLFESGLFPGEIVSGM